MDLVMLSVRRMTMLESRLCYWQNCEAILSGGS